MLLPFFVAQIVPVPFEGVGQCKSGPTPIFALLSPPSNYNVTAPIVLSITAHGGDVGLQYGKAYTPRVELEEELGPSIDIPLHLAARLEDIMLFQSDTININGTHHYSITVRYLSAFPPKLKICVYPKQAPLGKLEFNVDRS